MRDMCRDPIEGDIVMAGDVMRMVTYRSRSGAHQILYTETRPKRLERKGGCYVSAWRHWCKIKGAKPLSPQE